MSNGEVVAARDDALALLSSYLLLQGIRRHVKTVLAVFDAKVGRGDLSELAAFKRFIRGLTTKHLEELDAYMTCADLMDELSKQAAIDRGMRAQRKSARFTPEEIEKRVEEAVAHLEHKAAFWRVHPQNISGLRKHTKTAMLLALENGGLTEFTQQRLEGLFTHAENATEQRATWFHQQLSYRNDYRQRTGSYLDIGSTIYPDTSPAMPRFMPIFSLMMRTDLRFAWIGFCLRHPLVKGGKRTYASVLRFANEHEHSSLYETVFQDVLLAGGGVVSDRAMTDFVSRLGALETIKSSKVNREPYWHCEFSVKQDGCTGEFVLKEGLCCAYCKDSPSGIRLKACGACGADFFCSTRCLELGWTRHRRICAQVKGVLGRFRSSQVAVDPDAAAEGASCDAYDAQDAGAAE